MTCYIVFIATNTNKIDCTLIYVFHTTSIAASRQVVGWRGTWGALLSLNKKKVTVPQFMYTSEVLLYSDCWMVYASLATV